VGAGGSRAGGRTGGRASGSAGAGTVARRRNAKVISCDRCSQASLFDELLQRQIDPVVRGSSGGLHVTLIVGGDAEVGRLVEEEQRVIVCAGTGRGRNVARNHLCLTGTVGTGSQVGDHRVYNHRGRTGGIPVRITHQQQIGSAAVQSRVMQLGLRRILGG